MAWPFKLLFNICTTYEYTQFSVQLSKHKIVKHKKLFNSMSSHVVLCYLWEAIYVHILITIISMWLYVYVSCWKLEGGGVRVGHCEVIQ